MNGRRHFPFSEAPLKGEGLHAPPPGMGYMPRNVTQTRANPSTTSQHPWLPSGHQRTFRRGARVLPWMKSVFCLGAFPRGQVCSSRGCRQEVGGCRPAARPCWTAPPPAPRGCEINPASTCGSLSVCFCLRLNVPERDVADRRQLWGCR